MTDEQMRRTLEFILEQQAQFAVRIQRLEEDFERCEKERMGDRWGQAELEESFRRLDQLLIKSRKKLER